MIDLLLAAGLLTTSAALAASSAATRRWEVVKARVVHCYQVAPLGEQPKAPRRRQVIVVRPDGSEELHSLGTLEDETSGLYLAEAIYTLDGRPYPAEI